MSETLLKFNHYKLVGICAIVSLFLTLKPYFGWCNRLQSLVFYHKWQVWVLSLGFVLLVYSAKSSVF